MRTRTEPTAGEAGRPWKKKTNPINDSPSLTRANRGGEFGQEKNIASGRRDAEEEGDFGRVTGSKRLGLEEENSENRSFST